MKEQEGLHALLRKEADEVALGNMGLQPKKQRTGRPRNRERLNYTDGFELTKSLATGLQSKHTYQNEFRKGSSEQGWGTCCSTPIILDHCPCWMGFIGVVVQQLLQGPRFSILGLAKCLKKICLHFVCLLLNTVLHSNSIPTYQGESPSEFCGAKTHRIVLVMLEAALNLCMKSWDNKLSNKYVVNHSVIFG